MAASRQSISHDRALPVRRAFGVSELAKALERTERQGSRPKGSFYTLPTVKISLPYHKGRRSKTAPRNRTLVSFRQKICSIEDVARLSLEQRGFVVFSGDEVNSFILDFLAPRGGKLGSDNQKTFLDLAEFNGYPLRETAERQRRHRMLLRSYVRGDDSLFEEILANAVELAKRYHTYANYKPAREVGRIEIDGLGSMRGVFRETGRSLRKKRKSDAEKKLFLVNLADQFFNKNLDSIERRNLIGSYLKAAPFAGGTPDLFVFHPKKRSWFFTEVKSVSGSLSVQHEDWIEFIQRYLGEHYILVRIVPSDTTLHTRRLRALRESNPQ